MDNVLDDIAFLANSEHRVAILETLVEGARSRDDLREEVDASRVTVARILRDLETRNWVENTGQAYAVTPSGAWVCRAFTRLVDEVEAEHRLRQALQWVPPDLVTFDIRCLRDAETVLLDERDPTAVVRRFVDLHRGSDRARECARCIAPPLIDKHWELTVEGDAHVEGVLTRKALDVVADHSTARRQLHQMLDAANAHYFVTADIPISVAIVDDTVAINLTDAKGTQKGMLIVDDDTVRAWAVDLFETYRDAARPVEAELVTA